MTDTTINEPTPPLYRNRSPEIAKLAAALCKAQGAMEGARKDAENPGFKRGNKVATYADLASVWDAVRKPLSDNGLAVIQFPRTVAQGVEIETTLLHSSGEFMSDVLWVPCSKFDAHGMGSAITYGRRYALMAVAGIAPVDDDGNAAVASKGNRPERFSHPTDFVEEAVKDGLAKPDAPSQYNVDKLKRAIANEWIVSNTTPKGKEEQIFSYLEMARNPDEVAKIGTNNAALISAAPWKDEFEAGVDRLLQWFEKEAAPQ